MGDPGHPDHSPGARLRIAHLVPNLEEGGVERAVVELSRGMRELGHESFVVSAGGRLERRVVEDGGAVVRLDIAGKNPATLVPRARRLRDALRGIAPSVVHVHSRLPAWLLRLADPGFPVVSTVHGFNRVGAYSRVMTRAALVVAPCTALRDHLSRHYRVPGDRLVVIPWGIDPARQRAARAAGPAPIRRKCRGPGARLAVSVGRLSSRKGHDLFIRALALACGKAGNLFGAIVGGAPGSRRHARLERLARDCGIGDRVDIVGATDDIASVYRAADILVAASPKPEGFGRVALEAIAMDRPVVGARQGGLLDIVRDGVNGLLHEPGDLAGMADMIAAAAAREWGGISHTVGEFTLERTVREMERVYSRCARERGDPPGGCTMAAPR